MTTSDSEGSPAITKRPIRRSMYPSKAPPFQEHERAEEGDPRTTEDHQISVGVPPDQLSDLRRTTHRHSSP